jgi:hypothetical protein
MCPWPPAAARKCQDLAERASRNPSAAPAMRAIGLTRELKGWNATPFFEHMQKGSSEEIVGRFRLG